ncbi:MAG: putative transposase [Gammaproteobacteria bacterium]|jgi:putative transposase
MPSFLVSSGTKLGVWTEAHNDSVKDECLSKLRFFGEGSLRRALQEYFANYHGERNHQGKDNVLLFPVVTADTRNAEGIIACGERLGGLVKYYHRDAA